jgi:hypothetical protein
MLTVAQLVEHQFVELDVASSSLVRQPKRRIVQLGRTLALGARGHTFKSCYADHLTSSRFYVIIYTMSKNCLCTSERKP